jgi:putative DNA primase/helicase
MLENAQWDADPWSIACTNGVVSLKDGEMREAKQTDYIRAIIPTEYTNLQERCPNFDQFLKDIFDEDNKLRRRDTIKFMQRLFGYGITGLSIEHTLPILYGRKGRNGKDTLLRMIEYVLGEDVSGPVGQEVLLSGTKSPNSATPYIYQLRFKRLAWVSETNENSMMDAGQAKLLTGGGTLTARLLNQNPITFTPQHLLCLITNFKPRAPINDHALWNRLLLINFGISFVNNPVHLWQKKRDKYLFDKLKEEKSGILSWLIRGALDWQRQGLDVPRHIENTTESYQQEEDDFSGFVNMFEVSQSVAGMEAKDIYREYVNWASIEGIKPLGKINFGRRFNEYFATIRTGRGYFYKHLRLKEQEPESIEKILGLS